SSGAAEARGFGGFGGGMGGGHSFVGGRGFGGGAIGRPTFARLPGGPRGCCVTVPPSGRPPVGLPPIGHPIPFPLHPWGFHHHDHGHWVFRFGRWVIVDDVIETPAEVVTAPGPCTCLTKSYTPS